MSFIIASTGIVGLLFALYLSVSVLKENAGTDKMKEISEAIQQGAMAYLNRQYKTLIPITILIFVLLAYFSEAKIASAISFLVGAVFSACAGYIGMYIATRANARTTNAAQTSLRKALGISFKGGSVMGMGVVGLGILGVSLLYIFVAKQDVNMIASIDSFAFGASLIALFARVGGGIFTKAADVGADLVGKVEAGIPEDDPRNPAVIADNVGDNVGDVAGMGADLFESYAATSIAAMLLGAALFKGSAAGILLPLCLGAAGILASIIGTIFIYTGDDKNPQSGLNRSLYASFILTSIAAFFLTKYFLPNNYILFFCSIMAGLIANILIGLITEYYTSAAFRPVQQIVHASKSGAATNAIYGLSVGLESTAAPIMIIIITVVAAYQIPGGGANGFYGIALAAMGMLSMAGTIVAIDAYGPIADNAGGIAEMAGLDPKVREVTDKLDSVGNTTAAIAKGFAIGSAAITAIALFSAFAQRANLTDLNILDPNITMGLLFGSMIPFLFCAFAMRAVGHAAFDMMEEVRRQFREIPGLLQGKAKADYKKCVDISTRAALKRMVVPGLLAPLSIVVVGFGIAFFNPKIALQVIGGMLVGGTATGVLLALKMSNAGGAWDNAKKHIEAGNHGGKGSDTHKAAVVGDTVGDPFKDTAGPSLNAVIKVMGTISLIIAPIIASMIK
ncbi:MAG: sodium-translocating pyrophosphatase [Ignavibacteriales bacterium]